MLAILLSVRAYTIEFCLCFFFGETQSLIHKVIFPNNDFRALPIIICFGYALRLIFLIGYVSFTQYCLFLVKVWNNKSFSKPTFSIYAHFCAF